MKLSLSVAAVVLAQAANACVFKDPPKNFGSFDGDVVGKFVSKAYASRPLFELSEALVYTSPTGSEFTAIADYIVDGASIPRVLWSVIGGPFSGNHLKASVVHDYYTDTCQIHPHPEVGRACQNKLTEFQDDELIHSNYYLGMLAAGVSEENACAEYIAVSAYKTWEIGEDGRPTNILIFGRPIGEVEAGFLKKSFGFVIASAKAVIKTRNSGAGRTLNIFPDREIPATPEGMNDYLDRLRKGLNDETYLEDPDALGLLTDEQIDSFENLEPWHDGFLTNRLNPATGRFDDLTYFDPRIQQDPSSLAAALGLKVQPLTNVPLPKDYRFNFDDLNLQQDELLKQYFRNQGKALPGQLNPGLLKLRPTQDRFRLEYEVTPQLQELLDRQNLRGQMGNRGSIMLQSTPWGGQEIFIQPVPRQ